MFLGRASEDLVRKMLAFVPQSTCVDYLNMGLVRLFGCEEMGIEGLVQKHLPKNGVELLIQTHDGYLAQCLPERVEDFCALGWKAICVPMLINGRELVIPLKLKTGMNWGELK